MGLFQSYACKSFLMVSLIMIWINPSIAFSISEFLVEHLDRWDEIDVLHNPFTTLVYKANFRQTPLMMNLEEEFRQFQLETKAEFEKLVAEKDSALQKINSLQIELSLVMDRFSQEVNRTFELAHQTMSQEISSLQLQKNETDEQDKEFHQMLESRMLNDSHRYQSFELEITGKVQVLNTEKQALEKKITGLEREQEITNTSIAQFEQRISRVQDGQAKTGVIKMVYSTAAPSGWLLCDGTSIDCDAYPSLCQLVGPRTPDFRGRFPVGFSNHTNTSAIGQIGGEASHILTIEEMPSHSHSVYNSRGDISIPMASYFTASKLVLDEWKNLTTGDTGASKAHNNLPPYLTVAFIIKT